MTYGLDFEERLQQALRNIGCPTTVCETWDKLDMVDLMIMTIDGRRIWHGIEVQTTFQCDNYLKLRRYVRTRAGRRASSLYVELGRDVSPETAARAIRSSIEETLALPRQGVGTVSGIAVDKNGTRAPFDPATKVAVLERSLLPSHTAQLRREGTVVEVRSGALIIASDGICYWAYRADLVEAHLLTRMRRHAEGTDDMTGLAVSFIPDGGGLPYPRAKGVAVAAALIKAVIGGS
jgi:hypothetical protein